MNLIYFRGFESTAELSGGASEHVLVVSRFDTSFAALKDFGEYLRVTPSPHRITDNRIVKLVVVGAHGLFFLIMSESPSN